MLLILFFNILLHKINCFLLAFTILKSDTLSKKKKEILYDKVINLLFTYRIMKLILTYNIPFSINNFF